ncbi:MAG: hypothetical protein DMD79_25835, partial [Candidatus Rokuibacteriota bacterium]
MTGVVVREIRRADPGVVATLEGLGAGPGDPHVPERPGAREPGHGRRGARMNQGTLSRRDFLGTGAGLLAATALRPSGEAADPKVLRVRAYVNYEILDPAYRLGAPEG